MVARTRSNVKSTKWASHSRTVTGPGVVPGGGPVSGASYDFYSSQGGTIRDSVDPVRIALFKNKVGDYGTECSLFKKRINTSGWLQNILAKDEFGSSPSYYVQEWGGTRVPFPFRTNYAFNAAPTPDVSPIEQLQMDGWGAIGVNRAYPVKPQLSIAQSLAELKREGLPGLPGSQLKKLGTFAGVGGEYLNYQFGMKPIVNDMLDIIEYDKALAERLLEVRRTFNKGFRRKSTVLSEVTTTRLANTDLFPDMAFFASKYGGTIGAVSVTEHVTRDVWFSGEFRFLPPPEHPRSPLLEEMKDALFKSGLEPSPELLWQLTPWSWLLDWETSVGEAISNFSRFSIDRATMAYGYVMYRKVTKRIYSNPFFGSMEVESINFQRRRANPFGFGVTWDSLSDSQWAILAALGLSRGRSVKLT